MVIKVLGVVALSAVMMIYPVLIVLRIRNEEMVLEKELEGYKEYKTRVRFRLIPFVW